MVKETMRELDTKFPAYAWPGGYPLVYITPESSCLCADCAKEVYNDPDEFEEFKPSTQFIHYEGPPIYCEECNNDIPSAYGDPCRDWDGETPSQPNQGV